MQYNISSVLPAGILGSLVELGVTRSRAFVELPVVGLSFFAVVRGKIIKQ